MAAPAVGTVVDGYRFIGGDPNSQASWVQNSERTTPQAKADSDWLEGIRNEARGARKIVPMANSFLGYNQEAGTGGIGTALGGGIDIAGFRAFPALDRRESRQAMEGLTSDMMRATMLPGTSSTMNTGKEQEFAVNRLPNVNTKGPVNEERVRNIQRDAFMKGEQLKAAEAWIAQHGVPDGFEEHWARVEPVIAQQFRYQKPRPIKIGEVRQDPVRQANRAIAQRQQLPTGARRTSDAFERDTTKPFGSRENPFVARDQATLDALPKGSYAISPEGHFGVID